MCCFLYFCTVYQEPDSSRKTWNIRRTQFLCRDITTNLRRPRIFRNLYLCYSRKSFLFNNNFKAYQKDEIPTEIGNEYRKAKFLENNLMRIGYCVMEIWLLSRQDRMERLVSKPKQDHSRTSSKNFCAFDLKSIERFWTTHGHMRRYLGISLFTTNKNAQITFIYRKQKNEWLYFHVMQMKIITKNRRLFWKIFLLLQNLEKVFTSGIQL